MRRSARHLLRALLLALFAGLYAPALLAAPQEIEGHWYQPSHAHWRYTQGSELHGVKAMPSLSLSGGEYWYRGRFELTAPGRYVLDFKNSTTIGRFHHYLFDSQGRLLAERRGGIQEDEVENPFFLRHGREVELAAGEYILITRMSSPFYLAQPAPFISDLGSYRLAIKGGNALVMAGLGLFLGLGFYYAALSLYRRRWAESMYATFIFGNLLYNGTSLLVLPDLAHMHWFYMVSVPILFSNMAYIVFVMALLQIRRDSHPRLYTAGLGALALLAVMALVAAVLPNWSLEMDRAGVALFLGYGLSAGIARVRQGSKTAQLYLIAVGIFVIFGGGAISQSELPGIYTYHIEHLGLFAVMLEVTLLSFVISYQFRQLQEERESIYSDFTLEKQRREELDQAIAEAERANAAKTEFLSNMSHELRTPMNSILGFSEIMLEENELPKKYRDDVNRIHKAGSHLLRLINDVLDLSKIEAGRLELSIEAVDLNEVIEESFNLMQPLAGKRDITLFCHDHCAVPLLADRIRLKQVLLNLLSNGIKYNHPNGVVRVEIGSAANRRVRVSVVDTGRGIDREQLEALFEPFNRLAAESSEIEGTGIGLTLSRSMIEQMGGRMGVESKPDRGSLFWFELPVADAEALARIEQPGPVDPLPEVETGDEQPLLLYVDDNPMNLVFVERILETQPSIRLITAHEPELGLELAASHHPALIMLDINMPRLNGFQVLERIRQIPGLEQTPVFAVTADAVKSEIREGLDAGFNEFLLKPLEVAHFLELLQRYLPHARAPASSTT